MVLEVLSSNQNSALLELDLYTEEKKEDMNARTQYSNTKDSD